MDDTPDSEAGDTATESDGSDAHDTDGERAIDRVADHWDAVVADVEATAEEYREAGADVVELHPVDVVARPEFGGFDVPVPDAEFDALRTVVDDAALPSTDFFRARAGDVAFVAAVLTAPDGSVAVCCPLFYESTADAVETVERDSREAGALRALVRPTGGEGAVVLQFDDPELFFGAGSDGATDGPETDETT